MKRIATSENLVIMFKSSSLEVFLRKGVLNYAANLQENTHAELSFQ